MAESETRVVKDEVGVHLELPGIKLTVLEGPDRGAEITARRGVVRVGTASDNDLTLADNAISRRHAELRLRGPDVLLRDLGSTNGTTVDGVRVLEAFISPSSLIRLGDTCIRVSPVDEPIVVPLSSRERFGKLLGSSAAMRQAFALLERAAPTEATILIEGETGTGKELAAEGIHDTSTRSEGPFVAIDCGAVSANLIESELFGHVRGAFTGAVSDRRGVFEEAQGGTLFLDEIGELPLDLQPKLLRVLEKREIRRVGESRARPIDVRVVAATNRDLAVEVNQGTFREDLFFRLAVVRVRLPPLRSRRDDIPRLVRHFVERLRPDAPTPSPELVAALARKSWPGNVRELRNAVERALALVDPATSEGAPAEAASSGQDARLAELLSMPMKEGLDRWVAYFEQEYVKLALDRHGSVSAAARAAGVNRRHIQRLMKRHGMRDDEGDGEG
ncbi:MAG: sigma 54-interacting transcriptional regulator [Sandaracinaceae bacterium]